MLGKCSTTIAVSKKTELIDTHVEDVHKRFVNVGCIGTT
jgi:hypothetical protein